jgi:hypothetical protein
MGLEPPYLADREAQLQRFGRYLGGFPDFPRNVRVTGLRGVGKTVLLQRYAAVAEDAGWMVSWRECSEHLREESAFGLTLVEDCRRAVERSSRFSGRAASAVKQALSHLGEISVSLAGVTVAVRSVQRRHPAALEDLLHSALTTAAETATASGRAGLLLCLDEAQMLRDSPKAGRYPLSAFLLAVARAQREHVPLMLLLCGLPNLTEHLAAARSYSERMFQAEEIGALRPPEDRVAFCRPLEEAGRGYADEVAELVRSDTRGYPFYVQFYGALLWESVDWPEAIQAAHFHHLRPVILQALDRAFFDARLARASHLERALLRAIAASGEEASVGSVRAAIRVPNESIHQVIARLADKGLLFRPERGRLAFTVPLFGDYLRRHPGSSR